MLRFEIALGIIKDAPAGCVRHMFRECNPQRSVSFVDGGLIETIADKHIEYNASQHDMLMNDWIVVYETGVLSTSPELRTSLQEEDVMENSQTQPEMELREDYFIPLSQYQGRVEWDKMYTLC